MAQIEYRFRWRFIYYGKTVDLGDRQQKVEFGDLLKLKYRWDDFRFWYLNDTGQQIRYALGSKNKITKNINLILITQRIPRIKVKPARTLAMYKKTVNHCVRIKE